MKMKPRTFELDAFYAERLDGLAEFYGHQDKGKYAATLLKRAIEESEMWMRADLYSKHERLIADLEESERQNWERHLAENGQGDGYYDDDIPF